MVAAFNLHDLHVLAVSILAETTEIGVGAVRFVYGNPQVWRKWIHKLDYINCSKYYYIYRGRWIGFGGQPLQIMGFLTDYESLG